MFVKSCDNHNSLTIVVRWHTIWHDCLVGSWIIGKSYDIVRQSNESRTMTYGFTMIAWWEGNIALYEWCNGHATCMMSQIKPYDVVARPYHTYRISFDIVWSRTPSHSHRRIYQSRVSQTKFWTGPKTAKTLWYWPPPAHDCDVIETLCYVT